VEVPKSYAVGLSSYVHQPASTPVTQIIAQAYPGRQLNFTRIRPRQPLLQPDFRYCEMRVWPVR
ncbi:MAG: hypothetical protein ACYTEK_20035, partial [Planctomycetota bacterium]